MVLEIYRSISSMHLSGILLTVCNSLLDIVAVSEVKPLASKQDLCYAKGSKGERVAKDIWALPVDLSCNNTCSVANSLLEPNRSSSAILWRHVDVEPTHVQSRSVVDSNSTEESAEELNAMWCRADNQNVTNDSKDVRKRYKWSTDTCTIGEPGDKHECETTEDVYRNGKILCLKGVVTQRFDDTRQEGREPIQKDILTESTD